MLEQGDPVGWPPRAPIKDRSTHTPKSAEDLLPASQSEALNIRMYRANGTSARWASERGASSMPASSGTYPRGVRVGGPRRGFGLLRSPEDLTPVLTRLLLASNGRAWRGAP
jgi:hypothetical protein